MDNTLQLTFEQFAVIIAEKLRIPREQVQPETVLKDIDIDSLAIIEVMLAVESQSGASIPIEEVSTDGTVEDLYQLTVAALDASLK
jgi:acyl carrier protein